MATLLEVKNLKTYFFTHEGIGKAVDGISYIVREGETLALVGESGCGKSVSALSLLRLIPSPPGKIIGGQVLFNGIDLLKLSRDEMRRVRGKEIAMIFQEPMTSLNPVLTIERQLTEAMTLHLGMSLKQARTRAIELLELVSISDPIKRLKQYPHHFSGGMRQRVMIAIALSCNPKLIIADEPTTALDVTIQAQILDLMKDVTQNLGSSLIIITHNLGVVARYSNQINIMYAGKIIEQSSSRELYSNPRHPYTIGLLQSVPRLDRPRTNRLISIKGQPPDLVSLPKGCSFRPRCDFAIERCALETPPLMAAGEEHHSACWVAETLGTQVNEK